MVSSEPISAQRWCLGVPEARARAMSQVELDSVDRRRRRLRRSVLLVPVGFLAPLVLAVASADLGFMGLSSGFLVLAFAGLAIGIVRSLDGMRRARLLGKELRAPLVSVFECVLDEARAREITQSLELSEALCAGRVRFEVVQSSGRLHSIQGRLHEPFVLPECRVVASRPAASSEEVVSSGATLPSDAPLERALSEEERGELRRHARNAWFEPLRLGAALLVLGLLGGFRGMDLSRGGWDKALLAASVAAMGLITAFGVVRGVLLARRLRTALRHSAVMVARPAGDATASERLAGCDLLWTVGGRPADWRTSSRVERG